MANSRVTYDGDGTTTQRVVPFPFLSRDHVTVLVDGVSTAFTWINDGMVSISPAPASGTLILIKRSTSPTERLVDYIAGSLGEEELDTDSLQAFYLAQESVDAAESGIILDNSDGNWDGQGRRLKDLADPVDGGDAATKAWVNTSYNSGVDAGVAKAAAEAAQAAAESAQAAAEAAETAAGVHETAAEAAETAAEAAQAAAESARDSALSYRNTAEGYKDSAATSAGTATSAAAAAVVAKDAAEDAQAAAEVAQAAAEAATPGSVKITSGDTTAARLDDKLVVTGGSITKTVLNPGGNEQLQLSVSVDVSGKMDKSANLSDLANAATARGNLDVPTRTGGNASGTWGINISGNAATSSSCSGNAATVSSVSAAQVASGTAGVSFGAVGTYAFANRGVTAVTPGATTSGGLAAAAADGTGGSAILLPGTWRCMGEANGTGGAAATTLWLRIS